MKTAVSVVIPAFNSEKYIGQAIASALNQNVPEIEVIVVDDGSTDETSRVVHEWQDKDKRVQYIQQANSGPGAARNRGIREASGKFIAFLDADDYWLDGKLICQLAVLKENEDRLVYGAMLYQFDFDREMPEKKYVKYPDCRSREELIFAFLSKRSVVGITPSVMIKKAILDEVGIFEVSLSTGEDTDLWVRILARYDFIAINEPLFVRRKHHASQTTVVAPEEKFQNELALIERYKALTQKPTIPLRKCRANTYLEFSVRQYQDRKCFQALTLMLTAAFIDPAYLLKLSWYRYFVKIMITSVTGRVF